MIRGVLFDKDGTLLEYESTQHFIYTALLEALRDDYRVPEPLVERAREALGLLPGGLAPGSVLQSCTNRQIAETLSAVVHDCSDGDRRQARPDADDLLGLIETLSLADDVPYVALPHVPETLEYLRSRDYRLGVATVDTLSATVAGLRKTGILEHFDYLGTGDDSPPKPDPALADGFCAACGIRRDELLIVGDGENDMAFARAAGAQFVGIEPAGEVASVFRTAGQRSVSDIRGITAIFDL